MRDKGLVFEEMCRQRRGLGGPMVEEWLFRVVVVAALYLVASFVSIRAGSGRGPSEPGRHPPGVAQESAGLVRHEERVAGSGR